LATPEEIAEDLERHRKYVVKMLADLDVLHQKWLGENDEQPVLSQQQAG